MTRALFFLQKPFKATPSLRFAKATCHFHSSVRYLHSPSNVERFTPIKNSISEAPGFRFPKQITISSKAPNHVKYQDISEALRTFVATNVPDGVGSQANALVILATPAFAGWLEEKSGFIPLVLSSITKKDVGGSNVHDFDVICACVDGLSPKPGRIPRFRGQPALEGISFLYGQKDLVLPNWTDEEAVTTTDDSLQSNITFSTSSKSKSLHTTVPLATTLFNNGRHSTLLVSRWQLNTTNSFVPIRSSVERKHVTVQICEDGLEKSSGLYTPAVALTPARRITSGLGNIARRIEFDDGNVGPASEELEKAVAGQLKGRPGIKLDIWAMIVPSQAITASKDDFYKLATDSKMVDHRKAYSGTPDYSYIGYWLSQGAMFCRVLSGGGGWGAKQGLLSLDPQTSYDHIDEARFNFWESTVEEQQASALGTIAKEGDYIQFFSAKTKKLQDVPQYSRNNVEYRTTVIGTTPSTKDKVILGLEDKSGGDPKLAIEYNHFGCVSETGIFLRRGDTAQDTWVTKLDLPYSYIFYHPHASTIRLHDTGRHPRIQRQITIK